MKKMFDHLPEEIEEIQPPGEYPEHQKLAAIQEVGDTINSFLEWLLRKKDITLAGTFENELIVDPTPVDHLIAEFFNLDPNKFEEESVRMATKKAFEKNYFPNRTNGN